MKKVLFTFTFSMLSILSIAQEDKVDLDVLRAPSSPSSNLLGIATTDIDKPTDISSFVVSIQSASNSYSKFPSNYALDFSPFYLFMKKNTDFTTDGLKSKKFKDILKQTFIISTAISNPDSTNVSFNSNSTYAAIGFKFSIFRGDFDSITTSNLDKIKILQHDLTLLNKKNIQEYLSNSDDEYKELLKKREEMVKGKPLEEIEKIIDSKEYKEIEEKLSLRLHNFGESQKKEEQQKIKDDIKNIASEFQLERIGFSWDVNGGISNEFRNRNFNNSKVYNAGIWTNFGYTNKYGLSLLGLVRYLYNPETIYALDNSINTSDNVSTLDAGGRIVYSKSQSKFSISAEAVYRSVLSKQEIDPTWKFLLNADYSIFKNQKLTFSFGRNFDGTTTKDGNLIAALTFIKGFGNKK